MHRGTCRAGFALDVGFVGVRRSVASDNDVGYGDQFVIRRHLLLLVVERFLSFIVGGFIVAERPGVFYRDRFYLPNFPRVF